MESLKTTIKTVHVVHTTVAYADENWVRFDGSNERMYFGPDHSFKPGDDVKITFERTSP